VFLIETTAAMSANAGADLLTPPLALPQLTRFGAFAADVLFPFENVFNHAAHNNLLKALGKLTFTAE
ncbi:MAG: hypothetical protein NDI61_14825, partial [Bdellovibrionaceae bacterium]|nr:hypothetical protein [Pseudobdellovibrionaceae bacterium]